uniref:SH2 domain-containing protein n=1 Tax=Meloidogyne hapla TaxID=6305 RepID=A0A1I8BYH9_MELHA
MREEQLRKWRIREANFASVEQENQRRQKRNQRIDLADDRHHGVKWLNGRDGNVWVWVMGEHPSDLTIEQILENEAKERAKSLAEKEIIQDIGRTEDIQSLIDQEEAALKSELAKIDLNQNGTDSELDNKTDSHSPYDELPDESSLNDYICERNFATNRPFGQKQTNEMDTSRLQNNGYLENKMIVADKISLSSPDSQEIYDNLVSSPSPHSSANFLPQNSYDSRRPTQPNFDKLNGAKNQDYKGNDRSMLPPIPEKPASLRRTISSHLGNEPRFIRRDDLDDQNLEFNTIRSYIPQEEIEKRQSKIFDQLKEQRDRLEREAEIEARREQAEYEERKRKAREAEESVRRIAARARDQHRKNMRTSDALLPLFKEKPTCANSIRDALRALPRPPKPKSRRAILTWFWNSELEQWRGQAPPKWFHGIISREEAEKLLITKQTGAFLVRVTERIFGYTVSYRAMEGLKNFLVERIVDGYQFMGTNQLVHSTLAELVFYYQTHPITLKGGEVLLEPVGQDKTPPDYEDLFQPFEDFNKQED